MKEFHSFKKKRGGRNKGRKQQSAADDFFRGVGFSMGRDQGWKKPNFLSSWVGFLGFIKKAQ